MSTAVATPTRITRMRTPEFRPPGTAGSVRHEGQRFENEYYQYLKPESFTVLPPEAARAPSPDAAPEPYKLTPRRRHKNQAFSIIAEPGLSAPNSRAGSPTGRVSPFRGRGFNSTGSRHASPAPSPPPGELPDDDAILRHSRELTNQLRKSSIGKSQIPILAIKRDRRSSAEDLLSPETSPPEESPRSNLQSRYSRSMVNIVPRNLVRKPPPSPRKSNLKPSFVRLSPIIGSSPEAGSDQTSSPSRIPRSRSQPPSRLTSPNHIPSLAPSRVTSPNRIPSLTPSRVSSPNRIPSRAPSRVTSPNRIPRAPSRNPSRPSSRSTSREPSPGRSPSKIPMKNAFKNIPAKVETFNRVVITSKPKVPQKPKVYSTRTNNTTRNSVRKNVNSKIANSRSPRRETDDTETTDSEIVRDTSRNVRSMLVSRRNSVSKPNNKQSTKTKHDEKEKPSTSRSTNNKNDSSTATQEKSSTTITRPKTEKSKEKSEPQSEKRSKTSSQTFRKDDKGAKLNRSRKNESTTEDDDMTEDAKDDDILSVTIDEIIGSQTTKIVSATAETVVKPLNIETKLVNKSEDVRTSNNTSSNNPTNQNTTNNSGTNNSSNQKAASDSNTSNNPSNTNNPVNNLSTPANGSVVNTPVNNLTEHNQTNSSTPAPSLNATSESVTNNFKNVSNSLTPSVNSMEMNVKNNLNNLTPPDSDKVSSKSLMDSSQMTNSAKLKGRTVIVDEIKPIKITVREKSGDIEVQSGNFLPRSATNGIAERPLLPPSNHPQNADTPSTDATAKPGACGKIFSCCGKPKTSVGTTDGSTVSGLHSLGAETIHEGEKLPKCWEKFCCKKIGKVGDVNASRFSCFPKLKKGKNDENWAERRDSILSEPTKQPFSLKRLICCGKKKTDESVSRRTSMMSKKKSLSSQMQPPEKNKKSKDKDIVVKDTGPKLDATLVEHASHMRGAIPILPIPLAWICLICNVFLPGFGTILSGLFCLCIGIPRFSPRDSAKARVGAFLINIVVGISQCFTVLFCLVGWGWSIWWGVIMHKIAKKYKKIKIAEENMIEEVETALPTVNINNAATQQRDVERGS